MSALLEVEGLTAGYDGVPVLHEVDLRVPAGTICAAPPGTSRYGAPLK